MYLTSTLVNIQNKNKPPQQSYLLSLGKRGKLQGDTIPYLIQDVYANKIQDFSVAVCLRMMQTFVS